MKVREEWDSCSTQIPVDPFKQFCVQLLPPFWCTSASKSQDLWVFLRGWGASLFLFSFWFCSPATLQGTWLAGVASSEPGNAHAPGKIVNQWLRNMSVKPLGHFLGSRQSWDLHHGPEFPWERVHRNLGWHPLLTGYLSYLSCFPTFFTSFPRDPFLDQLFTRNTMLQYAFRCSIIYPKILEDLRRPSHPLSSQIPNISYLTHIPVTLLPILFRKHKETSSF